MCACQELLRPAFFPVPHLVAMLADHLGPSEVKAKPCAGLADHVAVVFASLPKLLVAIASWLLLLKYDILTEARVWQWWWVGHVVVRDLLITWIGGGFWEFLLYADASPVKAKVCVASLEVPLLRACLLRW